MPERPPGEGFNDDAVLFSHRAILTPAFQFHSRIMTLSFIREYNYAGEESKERRLMETVTAWRPGNTAESAFTPEPFGLVPRLTTASFSMCRAPVVQHRQRPTNVAHALAFDRSSVRRCDAECSSCLLVRTPGCGKNDTCRSPLRHSRHIPECPPSPPERAREGATPCQALHRTARCRFFRG